MYLVIWLISRDLTLIQAARVAMVKKQTGLTDGEMLAEKRDLAIEDKDSKNANKQEHIISEVGNLKVICPSLNFFFISLYNLSDTH